MSYGQPPGWGPPQQQPHVIVVQAAPSAPVKDVGVAYLLWFFLGLWGAHKFYLNEPLVGVIYFFTLGLCGLGLLVDLFLIPGQVRAYNDNAQRWAAYHQQQQMNAAQSYGQYPRY